MTNSLSLITTITLSASTIALGDVLSAEALSIAWDCFDRESNELVARSAIDLTSPKISCLPAAHGDEFTNNNINHEGDLDHNSEESFANETSPQDELVSELTEDNWHEDQSINENTGSHNWEEDQEYAEETQSSSAKELGDALGAHLVNLIGQGFADLIEGSTK